MMAQVSDQILEQFADNFRERLTATSGGSASGQTDAGAAEGVQSSEDNEDNASATTTSSASSATTSSAGNEINGFKFIFSTIVGLIKGLFQRK